MGRIVLPRFRPLWGVTLPQMLAGRAMPPRGRHLQSRGRRKNQRPVIQKIFDELPAVKTNVELRSDFGRNKTSSCSSTPTDRGRRAASFHFSTFFKSAIRNRQSAIEGRVPASAADRERCCRKRQFEAVLIKFQAGREKAQMARQKCSMPGTDALTKSIPHNRPPATLEWPR